MKLFRFIPGRKNRQGFSLVEAALSVGILSFGFLGLVPLLGLGLTATRQARDNHTSAQIAENFIDQAQQGTLTNGASYVDDQGNTCASSVACYHIQTATTTVSGNLTRLTVQVTPVSAPTRSQFYAVVLPPR